jgi:hypothetical protein
MSKIAKRFNEGKPKLSYFKRSFSKALEGIARVKEFGANKYGDGNWRAGGKPDQEYHDSMDRHIQLFLDGETYDQDSGCHHLSHAIWNLCALFELNHNEEPVIDQDLFNERIAYWVRDREADDVNAKPE